MTGLGRNAAINWTKPFSSSPLITQQHPHKNHCILQIVKHSHMYTTSIESASILPDISIRTLQARGEHTVYRHASSPFPHDCKWQTGERDSVLSSAAPVNQCRHPVKFQPFSIRKRPFLAALDRPMILCCPIGPLMYSRHYPAPQKLIGK